MFGTLASVAVWGFLICGAGLLRIMMVKTRDYLGFFKASVDEQAAQLVGSFLVSVGLIADAVDDGTWPIWILNSVTIGCLAVFSWHSLIRFFRYRRTFEKLWAERTRLYGDERN